MKYALLLFFLPSFCNAQFDSLCLKIDQGDSNSIYYDSVINVTGRKDDIFVKEKIWVSEILKYPTGPGILYDKDAGMIVFKSSTTILAIWDYLENKKKKTITHRQNFYDGEFKITIYAKDNKAKIIISSISYRDGMYSSYKSFWPLDLKLMETSKQKVTSSELQDSIDGENNIKMFLEFDKHFHKMIENFCIKMNQKSTADF